MMLIIAKTQQSITRYNNASANNQLNMWKTIGPLNPTNIKQSRSKDEVSCQPFGQASKLRLNESQLSGQKQHQFMNQYFTKRRSPESGLHRALSQKNIEMKQDICTPASLGQIESSRYQSKTQSKEANCFQYEDSFHDLQASIETQASKGKISEKLKRIREELRSVRDQQIKMKKVVVREVDNFRQQLKVFQREIIEKMDQMNSGMDKSSLQNSNPQLLTKIKQEGGHFNEKMREFDVRKVELKAKYKEISQKQ